MLKGRQIDTFQLVNNSKFNKNPTRELFELVENTVKTLLNSTAFGIQRRPCDKVTKLSDSRDQCDQFKTLFHYIYLLETIFCAGVKAKKLTLPECTRFEGNINSWNHF